jgi:hypothetical protein
MRFHAFSILAKHRFLNETFAAEQEQIILDSHDEVGLSGSV